MKIRLSMEGKALSVNFEEGADGIFFKLSGELLRASMQPVKTESAIEKPRETAEQPKELYKGLMYKGFIHWKCSDCGAVRSFCLKKESKGVHCMSCGSDHLFEQPLKLMYTKCECGSTARYFTNRDEEMFDIDCIDCGSPVAVKFNDNKGIFETIK